MERWAFAAALVLGTGCTPVAYLQYHGAQGWPTGAGFALYVDKVPVYVGLPNKPYDVVGLIDVYDDKPFFSRRFNEVKGSQAGKGQQRGRSHLVKRSNRQQRFIQDRRSKGRPRTH